MLINAIPDPSASDKMGKFKSEEDAQRHIGSSVADLMPWGRDRLLQPLTSRYDELWLHIQSVYESNVGSIGKRMAWKHKHVDTTSGSDLQNSKSIGRHAGTWQVDLSPLFMALQLVIAKAQNNRT